MFKGVELRGCGKGSRLSGAKGCGVGRLRFKKGISEVLGLVSGYMIRP